MHFHKPRWCSPLHTHALWCSLLLPGYKPLQRVAVLNTVGNCNTTEYDACVPLAVPQVGLLQHHRKRVGNDCVALPWPGSQKVSEALGCAFQPPGSRLLLECALEQQEQLQKECREEEEGEKEGGRGES